MSKSVEINPADYATFAEYVRAKDAVWLAEREEKLRAADFSVGAHIDLDDRDYEVLKVKTVAIVRDKYGDVTSLERPVG